MRLDKYLKNSRLVKRRTLAKEFADAGRVLQNGKVAKSSSGISTGDVLELTYGGKILEIKVLGVPEIVKKEQAYDMYEVISETQRKRATTTTDDDLEEFRNF